MLVTIRYGSGNDLTKDLPDGSVLGSVLLDMQVKAHLGYGDNVEGRIGSVPRDEGFMFSDGMVISVHDKACNKSGRVIPNEDGYEFRFYEGEVTLGEPLHIHVFKDGKVAKFWVLPTVTVAIKGKFRDHEIRHIMRIVKIHQSEIIRVLKDKHRASGCMTRD